MQWVFESMKKNHIDSDFQKNQEKKEKINGEKDTIISEDKRFPRENRLKKI